MDVCQDLISRVLISGTSFTFTVTGVGATRYILQFSFRWIGPIFPRLFNGYSETE
jgi:hypothetical protein